jgi:hypothetical protein
MRGKIKKLFRGIGAALALLFLLTVIGQGLHQHGHDGNQQLETSCQFCKTATWRDQATAPKAFAALPQSHYEKILPTLSRLFLSLSQRLLPSPRGPPSHYPA